MQDLNRHVRDSQIVPFIKDLYLNYSETLRARNNGRLTYIDLTIDDKFKLQALIMLALPNRDQFEYITEGRKTDEIPYFLANYMLTNDLEYLRKLEEALVQSAVLYNTDLADQLLNNYKREFDYEQNKID